MNKALLAFGTEVRKQVATILLDESYNLTKVESESCVSTERQHISLDTPDGWLSVYWHTKKSESP